MLRTEVKEALLLLGFALFMHEVFTPVTIGLVSLGTISIYAGLRPSRIFRNVLALGVLGTYWFTYGKVIDPEVGLNFLTTVVILKLMEKESERDQYMVFFGLLLVISVGTLFERTLSYVLFYSVSFLLLLRDFYRLHGGQARLRDLGLLFLWILPLTFGLFLLVPRAMSPIPMRSGTAGPGEIGYTTTVNFSSVEGLSSNDKPAFVAQVKKQIPQGGLYWRGNTISLTDGWNWNLRPLDRPSAIPGQRHENLSAVLEQNIRSFNKEEFLFSLDHPMSFTIRGKTFVPGDSRGMIQDPRRWVQRYDVISLPAEVFKATEEPGTFLRANLSNADQEWIRKSFKGQTAGEIVGQIQDHFRSERFEYTLKPGLITSFKEFMQVRKAGFCSHYASAVALIFRTKNIPARLVSGFMGGQYNPFGNFYLISQNDAHVWVEVMDNGAWLRLDPTGWVAPDRVRLGGEAFMHANTGSILGNWKLPGARFFQDMRLWFGQWDFRFYQWLEQVDYHWQEAWPTRMALRREWFYTLAPLVLLIFVLVYGWQLKRKKRALTENEAEVLWVLFQQKLKKRGLQLPLTSVQEAGAYLFGISHPDRSMILEVWELLVRHSFALDKSSGEILKKLKRL